MIIDVLNRKLTYEGVELDLTDLVPLLRNVIPNIGRFQLLEIQADGKVTNFVTNEFSGDFKISDVEVSRILEDDFFIEKLKTATISIYVFPLPVVEKLVPSEDYPFDQELSDLLDRLSVRGGKVKTDPASLTVTAEFYDAVASLLPQSIQDKIAKYKQ